MAFNSCLRLLYAETLHCACLSSTRSGTRLFPGMGAFLWQTTAMTPSAPISRVMSHSRELLGVAVRKVTPFLTVALQKSHKIKGQECGERKFCRINCQHYQGVMNSYVSVVVPACNFKQNHIAVFLFVSLFCFFNVWSSFSIFWGDFDRIPAVYSLYRKASDLNSSKAPRMSDITEKWWIFDVWYDAEYLLNPGETSIKQTWGLGRRGGIENVRNLWFTAWCAKPKHTSTTTLLPLCILNSQQNISLPAHHRLCVHLQFKPSK